MLYVVCCMLLNDGLRPMDVLGETNGEGDGSKSKRVEENQTRIGTTGK